MVWLVNNVRENDGEGNFCFTKTSLQEMSSFAFARKASTQEECFFPLLLPFNETVVQLWSDELDFL